VFVVCSTVQPKSENLKKIDLGWLENSSLLKTPFMHTYKEAHSAIINMVCCCHVVVMFLQL